MNYQKNNDISSKIEEILVLDIETSRIDPRIAFDIDNDLICEIGIVNLNLDTGKITPVLDTICKEDIVCSPESWIFNNSDLTFNDVERALCFSDIKETIQTILDKGPPATAYNQEFDFSRLVYPTRSINIRKKFWDPMKILKPIMKLEGELGYKYPRLEEAYRYLFPEKPFNHLHRGLSDATMEAEIIFELVKRHPYLKLSNSLDMI